MGVSMSSSVCSVECDGDDEEMRANNKLSTSWIGQWGSQDMDKALELWSQAAELGSAKAHFKMAKEYYEGNYIKRDVKKHKHHCSRNCTPPFRCYGKV